jgi:WD40 repeat protein
MTDKQPQALVNERKTTLDNIAQAFQLSAHVLLDDPNQLTGQLIGRLLSSEAPYLKNLIQQGIAKKETPWLCPLRPTLTAPGSPLLRTLEAESVVNAVAVTPDGNLVVSGSRDHMVRVWDLKRGVCIHTLTGHSASVRALALTSDGRYSVSGSLDRTLRIWDLKTGDCVNVLPVIDRVRTLALSSDDRIAVTSGADHEKLTPSEIRKLQSGGQVTVTRPKADDTIRVWDLVSGSLQRSIKADSTQGPTNKTAQGIVYREITRYDSPEPIGEIRGLAITPDGQFIVAGSSRYTKHRVRIWRLKDGKRIHALEGHTDEVWSVIVTPDGHHVISGSADGTIRVWHLQSGRCVKVLAGHRGGVRSLAIMRNGYYLVSGGSDKTVKIWDLTSGKCICTLPAHSYWILSVAVTWDGHLALSGSEDRTVRVWDLDRAREPGTRKVERHRGEVWDVKITMDGCFALSGAEDATLRVWDIRSGDAVGVLHGHNGAIYTVAQVPDRDVVVSASQDGTIRVWDLEEQREVQVFDVGGTSIGQIAITPDGRYVVSGEMIPVSSNGQPTIGTAKGYNLRVWDLQNGDRVHVLKGHKGPINSLVLTPNGQAVLSASADRTLRLWSLQTGGCLRTLKGHTGSVRRVVISPDGRLALSASADSTLRLWELKDATCLKVLDAHTDQVLCVRMTPNGRLVLSGGRDHTLRLWDLEKGMLLRTFYGHRGMVGTVAITPDGRYGLSGSEDHTLRVWDLARGNQVAALYADRAVNSLAYRSDTIVFGDDQGHIHLVRMHGFRTELPFVTAHPSQTQQLNLVDSRRMVARCPLCGDRFRVRRKHTTFISDQLQSAGLRQTQSRCLHLPPEAWDRPELQSKCPGCGQPLRFNPFIADEPMISN